jgi:hypothetical protein
MTSFRIFYFILFSNIIFYNRQTSAFLATTTSTTKSLSPISTMFPSRTYPDTSSFILYSDFQQLPGESNTEWIKRVTTEFDQQANNDSNNNKTAPLSSPLSSITEKNNDNEIKKPTGKYQSIEEWEAENAERKKKGELTWEERVQFDGQRHGDQVKQNWILNKHLGL